MKKYSLLLAFVFLTAGLVCAQNVIITQGEWNFLSPPWLPKDAPDWYEGDGGPSWLTGSIGTNILIYKTIIQDEMLISLGNALIKDASGEQESAVLFTVSDNIFAAFNTKIIGIRAGFSGAFGFYSGGLVSAFFSLSGLMGIHILPESLFSFTLDIHPGYTLAFNYDYSISDLFSAFSGRQYGWTFPLVLGVRLNLDKL
jgi:hypothetical protein